MVDSEVILVNNLSKNYHIYASPSDRLKQAVRGVFSRLGLCSSRVYFEEFPALADVSFSIRRGERVGIIGKNGSGKSTLLQLLCGTLLQTDGTVFVNGRVGALLELGSGFNPEFTGRENAILNASILGLSRLEIESALPEIIKFADIGDFIDRPVKMYSSGMFVRLAFSVIAHVNADVLIVDEALAVGDVFFNQKCMRFMEKFSEHGTIILVTHDTAAVTGFCNRAIWLDRGRLVADGDTKKVCEKYLAAIYGAKEKEDSTPSALPLEYSRVKPVRDARQDFVNASALRNDIEVFDFYSESSGFGDGRAAILDVFLANSEGVGLAWCVGGEAVVLNIAAKLDGTVRNPIFGFVVKNKLGQNLFGDNTFLTTLESGMKFKGDSLVKASFFFQMPILPCGDYVVSVAVADGVQSDHVICTWMHDALAFRSHSTSISTGLVGIPMEKILLNEI